jgi:hypothetical protein
MKVYCNECRYIKDWGSWGGPECAKEKAIYSTPLTVRSGYKSSPDMKNKNNDCPDYQLGFWGAILLRPLRKLRQRGAQME